MSIDQSIRRSLSPTQMAQQQQLQQQQQQQQRQPQVTKDDFEVLKRSQSPPSTKQPLGMRGRSNTNPNIQRSRRSDPGPGHQSQLNSQQLQSLINPHILTQPASPMQNRPAMPVPSQQRETSQVSVQGSQAQQRQQVPVQVHRAPQQVQTQPQLTEQQMQQQFEQEQQHQQKLQQQRLLQHQQQKKQRHQQQMQQHLAEVQQRQQQHILQQQQQKAQLEEAHHRQQQQQRNVSNQVTINMSRRTGSRTNLADEDAMSVQSVPHMTSHNNSYEDERPRSRAVSIEDLHRSPSRAKTMELTRSRQDLSIAKFVSSSQTRRGPQTELAAASSASPGPRRRARSGEGLRRPASPAQPPVQPPVPRPRSRAAVVRQEEDGRGSPVSVTSQQQQQQIQQQIQQQGVQEQQLQEQQLKQQRIQEQQLQQQRIQEQQLQQQRIQEQQLQQQRIQQQQLNQQKQQIQQQQMENDLKAKMNQLEAEKKELLYENFKAADVIKDLEDKIQTLDKMYKAERDAPKELQSEKVGKLLETNKILQTTVSKVQSKVDKLEVENEELKVDFAVMKAEKHNAISALETFKVKQQNITDEMGHLYKLNSEQAVRITEFEKEKKLNAEEFAHLYKTKKEQAARIKELEKGEKDLTTFHKTISEQAVKISELETKLDKAQTEMSNLSLAGEKKTAELKQEQSDKTDEIERLKKLVNELKMLNDDLQVSKKTMQEKQSREYSDLKTSINLLEKENEQLRKATAEQSVKIVELENVKNENKEHLQTQPKKDLLKDINKLKEHYLETIDNWKTKYEDTKMLLNLRDQELLIYKRRGEKKLIDEDKDTLEEIDTDGKQKGVDTVDDDEK